MPDNPTAPALGEEEIPPDEAGQIERITAIHLSVTNPGEKPVPRGQHMKGHGCVRAEFIVEAGLQDPFRHGVLSQPRVIPAYIRFSNGKGQDDRQGDAHGMAIKLLGVEGKKLLDDENDAPTQDFILIDHPVFFIKNVADYVPFMEDFRHLRSPGLTLGKVIAGLKLLLSQDYKWRLLRATGSKKPDSPLRIQYWSTTPSRLGSLAVKYTARPEFSQNQPGPAFDSPDKLRLAMAAHLKEKEARFDFLVRVQTDPIAMPVEDPTVDWGAPWQKVATIRIPPQTFDSPEQMIFGENLSFTPWHSLPEHRPLGGINRTRKAVYQAISKQRHELNGVRRVEPDGAERF
jgi:hypothetical protein